MKKAELIKEIENLEGNIEFLNNEIILLMNFINKNRNINVETITKETNTMTSLYGERSFIMRRDTFLISKTGESFKLNFNIVSKI